MPLIDDDDIKLKKIDDSEKFLKKEISQNQISQGLIVTHNITPDELKIKNERIKENKKIDLTIDQDVKEYVQNILDGKEVDSSITVGFLSEKAARDIEELTGLKVYGNRVVLEKDSVIHIEKRHGKNGKHDQTLENVEEISKIGYIVNNYDNIRLTNNFNRKYKTAENNFAPVIEISKEMDGMYYVIEAISDSKKKRNYVITAYKTKK